MVFDVLSALNLIAVRTLVQLFPRLDNTLMFPNVQANLYTIFNQVHLILELPVLRVVWQFFFYYVLPLYIAIFSWNLALSVWNILAPYSKVGPFKIPLKFKL